MISPSRNKPSNKVRSRVKIWLESDGKSVMCRGLCDMLRAVEETGSIKSAAAKVGRSYRFVWSRIKEAEQAFGTTLVESRVGGHDTNRSELSPLARDLLNDFDELCRRVYELADDMFDRQMRATLQRHGQRV